MSGSGGNPPHSQSNHYSQSQSNVSDSVLARKNEKLKAHVVRMEQANRQRKEKASAMTQQTQQQQQQQQQQQRPAWLPPAAPMSVSVPVSAAAAAPEWAAALILSVQQLQLQGRKVNAHLGL
jgi:hypothetical protein